VAATADPGRRAATAAAVLIACGVAVGAAFLGAPPRFSAGASGPDGLRAFLASLAPLSILEATIALAFGALVAAECLASERPGLPGGASASRTRLPLVLLLVLGLVQLVPLPAGVLRVVAPFSARTYASLAAGGDDTARPMTLWRDGTAHALFTLAGVNVATTATMRLVRGERARRNAVFLLAAVAAVAVVESAHGLVATKLGDDRLLGVFEKASDNGRVTGTFVHGTMMAVWAGMGVCALLGLGAASARSRPMVAALAACGAALCGVAALLTLSRLGFAAVLVGAATTLALVAAAFARDGRRVAARSIVGVAALLVVAGGIVALTTSAFRQRLGYLSLPGAHVDLRVPTWRSTWDLFREAPVLGTGLGSFGRAIHLTQSVDCPQELWFAHSDPLNLLSDVGVVGAALAAWWIFAVLRAGRGALRSDDLATRLFAAGAFGAAAVVLVASLGDFQTQFPVVAIPFAALATLPAALADATSPADDDRPRPGIVPPKFAAAVVAAAAIGVAAAPIAESVRRCRDLDEHGATGATRAETLVAEGRAWLAAAPKFADPRGGLVRAESLLREAARLDPLLDEAHVWTAYVAWTLDESSDDVLRALGRARVVARGHAQTNLLAGQMYLALLGTSPAPYGPPGDGATAALREAGALDPKAFVAAWRACEENRASLDTMRAITPDRGHAKIRLAEHLRSLGRNDDANRVLMDQLEREPWDEDVSTRLAAAMR